MLPSGTDYIKKRRRGTIGKETTLQQKPNDEEV